MGRIVVWPLLALLSAVLLSACFGQPGQGDRLRYVLEIVDEPEAKWPMSYAYDLARKDFLLCNVSPPRVVITLTAWRADGSGVGCALGFDALELIIEVVGEGRGFRLVNYTLVLANASFVQRAEGPCSSALKLPIKGVAASPGGDKVFCGGRGARHSFSKLLLVNETAGEVVDYLGGARYGEWVFWLRPEERRFNFTFVLFGYTPALERGYENGVDTYLATGIADLVLVNFNATDSSSYTLNWGAVVIEPVDTVAGRGWWGSFMEALLREFPQAYSAPHLIDPSKLARFVEERTLSWLQACEEVSRYKPWRALPEFERSEGFETPRLALEYAGTRLTPYGGCDFKAVYDRGNLVLIYLKLPHEALAFSFCRGLRPLFIYFSEEGLTVEWDTLLSRGVPALKLVESTVHKAHVKLGGPGGVDVTVHAAVAAAVVAVAALLAILASGRRRWR